MPDEHLAPPTTSGGILLDSKEELERIARKDGIICSNPECGRVISGAGFEFLSYKPVVEGTEAAVRRAHVFICDRDECAGARAKARKASTACRPVAGGWELPEGESDDADAEQS